MRIDQFLPDPYEAFREAGHVVVETAGLRFPLAVGFDEVRRLARDWPTFTSDTPFEVPIPHEHGLRPVRQLPIETDPPRHTALRALADPAFSRTAVEAHAEVVADVAAPALRRALEVGKLDVGPQLALPVVNHTLAAVLGRPATDVDLWLSWGTHVFDASGGRSGNTELDRYLEAAVEAARPGDPGFFGLLAGAEVDGRSLSHDEKLGFGNLVFAGGRDTVVSAIVTLLTVLAGEPRALGWLREDLDRIRPAVEEVLRVSSPLPYIGRHATAAATAGGCPVEAGGLVALGFGAANHDPAAFADPSTCDLARRPNRHIAFGHGPHTCIGAHLARMELRVVLEQLLELVGHVELLGEPRPKVIELGGREVAVGFDGVSVRLSPR